MKENEFDHIIKIKVDTLEKVSDIKFDDSKVWEKIKPQIPQNPNGGFYLFFSAIILISIGAFYYFFNAPNNSEQKTKATSIPIQKDTVIDNVSTLKEVDIIEKVMVSVKKTNKINDSNSRKTVLVDTINISKTTIELPKVTTYQTDSIASHNNDYYSSVNFAKVPITRAYVHVYRPGKVVGALNVFTFKVNGEKKGKITNGEHEIFLLEAGQTEFEIKRKTIQLNLEAGKSYYLRTELVFLGKAEFIEVSESYAKKEMGL